MSNIHSETAAKSTQFPLMIPRGEPTRRPPMGGQCLHCGVDASRSFSPNALCDDIHRNSTDSGYRNKSGGLLSRAQVGGPRMGLWVRALTSLLVGLAAVTSDSYAISGTKHILALVPRP